MTQNQTTRTHFLWAYCAHHNPSIHSCVLLKGYPFKNNGWSSRESIWRMVGHYKITTSAEGVI